MDQVWTEVTPNLSRSHSINIFINIPIKHDDVY